MMRAFPFDSKIVGYDADGLPNYDRASNSEEFARLLASFLSNGLFSFDMCEVLAGTGMKATVQTGACMIEGRYGYIVSPETVTFDPADATPRIDTVVLQLNLGTDVRTIRTRVHKGVASGSPSAPALSRDNTVWELGLADVLIPANSTAIAQSRITDTRLNTNRCGAAAAINSSNAASVRMALGLGSGSTKNIQAGSFTVTVAAGNYVDTTVPFSPAFPAAPAMSGNIGNASAASYTRIGISPSAASAVVRVYNEATTEKTLTVLWIAVSR